MNVCELKKDLIARGIRHGAVSYEKGVLTAAEQYCISKQGAVWEVYYFERGHKNNLRVFADEGSACAHLKSVLDNDRTVWESR